MNGSAGELRRDLNSVAMTGSRRSMRVVVDDISGRIARVSDDLWQALQSGTANQRQWQQAKVAGWTRERTQTSSQRFSPLSFRITLGSIDGIARRLAPVSGVFFSKTAFSVWTFVSLLTLIMLAARWSQLSTSTASLRSFFVQASPAALAGWFIVTKAIHELAHGVMCRRVGSRCGPVGMMFLCGMPFPFCDVSDVVRHPSRLSRAAVMMAGIYAEWIVATIAAIVWMNATSPVTQLHAMNLMIVCGISTLLFNANPLMRYDGYFVLSDFIDSFHLRSEAGDAFDRVVVSRLAGPGYQSATLDRSMLSLLSLSIYHVASMLYRVLITITIAAFLVTLADRFHLRTMMMLMIAAAGLMAAYGIVQRAVRIVRGKSRWSTVPAWRRWSMSLTAFGLAAMVMFIPLPRYRSSQGIVDAVTATKVFLPQSDVIESVLADFGDAVHYGETLVRVRDDAAVIDQAKLQGQLRLAQVRSEWARHETTDHGDFAHTWATHHAVEDSLRSQLVSVRRRVDRAEVRSPLSGIVLPSEPIANAKSLSSMVTLSQQLGTLGSLDKAWCRISPDGRVHAVFNLNANDHHLVTIGSAVRIVVPALGKRAIESIVESVSPIDEDKQNVMRRAGYKVVCPLPPIDADAMLSIVGTQCHGVVKLPWRSIAQDSWFWLENWIRD